MPRARDIYLRRTMTFRCGKCLGANRVAVVWTDAVSPARVRCARCGQRFQLPVGRSRMQSDLRYSAWVKRYADHAGLDVATAFSVVEGIMTAEQAARFRRGRGIALPPARVRLAPYAAVLAVVMFVGVVAYVSQYWSRSSATPTAAVSPPTHTTAGLVAGASADASATRPDWAWDVAETRVDDKGQLTLVTAADPASVLLAFCNGGRGAYLRDPLGLVEAPPPDRGTLLGVYRDHEDLTTPRAIRIYRDPRTQQWSAGDASGAITCLDASAIALRDVVPVTVTRSTIRPTARADARAKLSSPSTRP